MSEKERAAEESEKAEKLAIESFSSQWGPQDGISKLELKYKGKKVEK